MTDRRTVRATSELFDDPDRQLPAERGANGEPSRRDFEVFELLPLVDEIAERWDEIARRALGHRAGQDPSERCVGFVVRR